MLRKCLWDERASDIHCPGINDGTQGTEETRHPARMRGEAVPKEMIVQFSRGKRKVARLCGELLKLRAERAVRAKALREKTTS